MSVFSMRGAPVSGGRTKEPAAAPGEAPAAAEGPAGLDPASAKALYDRLVESFPEGAGKDVSRAEREELGLKSSTLVYGEITFEPFAEQLLKLHAYGGMPEGGIFYDIGCGTGKPVFAAALLHPFRRCAGIEVLTGLSAIAERIRRDFDATVRPALPEPHAATEIEIIRGDATALDWRDGDVVFLNSTCFSGELMAALARLAERLRHGAFVITTTKRLPSEAFELLEVSSMVETWGTATCFLHRRCSQ